MKQTSNCLSAFTTSPRRPSPLTWPSSNLRRRERGVNFPTLETLTETDTVKIGWRGQSRTIANNHYTYHLESGISKQEITLSGSNCTALKFCQQISKWLMGSYTVSGSIDNDNNAQTNKGLPEMRRQRLPRRANVLKGEAIPQGG